MVDEPYPGGADRGALVDLHQTQHLPVGIPDVIADHHLQLAAGFDDGDDPLHPFQHLLVDPPRLFEDEPQARGAMGDAHHVVITTD